MCDLDDISTKIQATKGRKASTKRRTRTTLAWGFELPGWEASEEAGWGWIRTAGAAAVVLAVVALAALPAAVASGLVPPGGAIAALLSGAAAAVAAGKGASFALVVLEVLKTPDR